jgi:hypothetical protein
VKRAGIAIALTAVVAAAVIGLNWTAFAGGPERDFEADLSGANEVPSPVDTAATGEAEIEFDKDYTEAEFELKVNDGVAVTQAHIHCNVAGMNGPIAVFLAGLIAGGINVDGKWVSNAAFTDDTIDPEAGCGSTLEELAQAMRDGRTYVNVHTVAHPAGEIRGQLEED